MKSVARNSCVISIDFNNLVKYNREAAEMLLSEPKIARHTLNQAMSHKIYRLSDNNRLILKAFTKAVYPNGSGHIIQLKYAKARFVNLPRRK